MTECPIITLDMYCNCRAFYDGAGNLKTTQHEQQGQRRHGSAPIDFDAVHGQQQQRHVLRVRLVRSGISLNIRVKGLG
jgi:hypothetical protein